jgi:hypothetical protein
MISTAGMYYSPNNNELAGERVPWEQDHVKYKFVAD